MFERIVVERIVFDIIVFERIVFFIRHSNTLFHMPSSSDPPSSALDNCLSIDSILSNSELWVTRAGF